MQTEKTNANENSLSNYEESKIYKLDLNNLKLNVDTEDKTKNSFIDPVTQRECSFIQSSELNNSNFLDDHYNKENEVVICISNLDMKIDESIINTGNVKNNVNHGSNRFNNNNFLLNLNTDSTDKYDENNFYHAKDYMNKFNNKNKDINSNIPNNKNIKNGNFIESKFEEIKFNLNKIKNNRGQILLNESDNSRLDKSKQVTKLEITNNNPINSERSKNKVILSTRNDKALDSKNIETEYLETESNIKLNKNKRKKKLIVIIILLIFFILLILAVLIYFFVLKQFT